MEVFYRYIGFHRCPTTGTYFIARGQLKTTLTAENHEALLLFFPFASPHPSLQYHSVFLDEGGRRTCIKSDVDDIVHTFYHHETQFARNLLRYVIQIFPVPFW